MRTARRRGARALAGAALATALAAALGCSTASPATPNTTAGLSGDLRVEVLAKHPHDVDAFTQGLEVRDEVLYESTGRYGESDVRVVEPGSGEVTARMPLPIEAFGEGLTIVDDQIWVLTWQEGYALRYERETLVELERVPYDGEGWGLCHDPDADRLVMSNGTAELTFRDPETFAPISTIVVTRDGNPVPNLNELECVDGQVWANVWQTDEILRIDPANGQVRAVVDASGLLSEVEAATSDVLNGIAAIPGTDTFFITGKLWPWLYEVRFVPAG